MTVQAGALPLDQQMEAAEQRRRRSFRTRYLISWAVIIGALIAFLGLTVGLNIPFLREWAPFILAGIPITLLVSALAITLACVLALLGALGRLSSNGFLNGIASLYVSIVRGTPLIVQIYFIYLALPAAGIILDAFICGVIALGFNYGAFLTETFRGGIQAVPHGQVEAARSLGMPERVVFLRVILPQAVRIVIPMVGNEFIAMIKDSALVSIIGVEELLLRSQEAGRPYGQSFQTITFAAAVYWMLTMVLSYFQTRLEKRMAAGDRAR
jgi:polar amino acid transport system permease protein